MRRLGKRLPWIIAAVLIAGGTWYGIHRRRAKQNEDGYRTAAVERRDVVVSVTAVGVLEPLTTVDVKANVAGEIVELAVDRGDYVSAGDLIARVDPTETRTAYDQAQADVAAALARVQETAAELHRQRTVTPEQVRVAEDAVATAEVRIKQAESALAFQRRSTEANIRRGEETLASAEARLRQAEARAEAQPDLTAASVAQAKAEQRAAEQTLRRLKEATHPQERAAAKSSLEAARIALANAGSAVSRLESLYVKGYVAKQAVEDAETSLASAQEQFDSARATYESLAEKQAADLDEAAARVEQAKAGLKAATLGEADVRVAKQELEAARAAVREAQASLDAARASRAQDEQRQRELEAAKAQAEESRSQLRVAKVGELQPQVTSHQVTQARAQAHRSQAQLENAAKNLAYTTIVAPRAGLVTDRYVEQGTVISSGRSMVGEGPSLVTIADVSRMFLLAEVDEADVGQVVVGQPVEIEVETFRDEVFRGQVTQVYPKGEVIENVTVFRVRIELGGRLEGLRPGMTAEASIIIDRAENVLACPNEAVFQRRGETLVEILEKGEPKEIPVQTGLASFEWTVIESGLSEGQEVIVTTPGGPEGFGGPGGPGGPGGRGGGNRPGGGSDNRDQMRRMMRMGGGRR